MLKIEFKSRVWYSDKWILFNALAILVFGLLMVSSASMVISDRRSGFPFYYLIRQSAYVLAGLVLAFLATRIPLRVWRKWSGYLILLSVLLLILVLIPGIGHSVNGSRRWIHLGFFSLQVTELVKIFSIVYVSNYLVRHQESLQKQVLGSLPLIVLLGIMALLLLLEPDFGTFVVIAFTFLALLFISGVRLFPFIILFALAVVGLATLAVVSPYRMARLTTFLNPWVQPYGSGYQLTQSLIAFGRGGLFGVGLGNSVQKLFYLPEAHTDFVFAVIGEELGLVGELLVMALYVSLIARIFYVGRRAQNVGQDYSAYLAYGIGFWLGFQALINLGVSVGMLPTKGITLPLISYGGSSLIVNCVALALVLRVAYEATHPDGAAVLSLRHARGYSSFQKRDRR